MKKILGALVLMLVFTLTSCNNGNSKLNNRIIELENQQERLSELYNYNTTNAEFILLTKKTNFM